MTLNNEQNIAERENENMKERWRYIGLSESIVTTDRWQSLENKLVSPHKNLFSSSKERTVFFRLLEALGTTYEILKFDYYENKYSTRSLLAWRARNLLEINTWCRYCCEDRNNAEIFFNEAAKDILDIEESLEKWGKKTDQPDLWFDEIKQKKDAIFSQAQEQGVLELDSKYTSTTNAAKTFGHDNVFKVHNKILSKFAHPTALSLFSFETPEQESKRAFYFFSQGCLFFFDGFSRLEKFIEEIENQELDK